MGLYSLHIVFDVLIFLLSCVYIMVSSSHFDAINNSLSMLILNYLHSMGSKYYLMDMWGEYNSVIQESEYLSLVTSSIKYDAIYGFIKHFVSFNMVFMMALMAVTS